MSRRLPIYILFDTYGFMEGKPIAAAENSIKALETELLQNPCALEAAYLSVITFDSNAKQIVPLTELSAFKMPSIQASKASKTLALGEVLSLLAQKIETEVNKKTLDRPGDMKPLVFIFTNGQQTDNLQNGLAEFKKCEVGIVFACVTGSDANVSVLKQITEIVVQFDAADPASMKEFFQWALSCWNYLITGV